MADQTAEIKFGFRRTITCGQNQDEVDRRVEDIRKRLERELQLATKDNTLELRAQPSYAPTVLRDAMEHRILHPRTL